MDRVDRHFGAVEAFFIDNMPITRLPLEFECGAIAVFGVTILRGIGKTTIHRQYGHLLRMIGVYPAVPLRGFTQHNMPEWWVSLSAVNLITASRYRGLHQARDGYTTLVPVPQIESFLHDPERRRTAWKVFNFTRQSLIQKSMYDSSIRVPSR